jgi:sporulation protein YlmC with PRC-barrel domain
MKPTAPLKLVSELLDLPIVDREGRSCGIVDDIEFAGAPGEEAWIESLLVGPGAYRGRLPRWLFWFVRKIAGDRVARVPLDEIDTIGPVVRLKCAARDVKLHIVEDKVRQWIPRKGAL